jgi:hypothetical protein
MGTDKRKKLIPFYRILSEMYVICMLIRLTPKDPIS